MGCSSCGVNGKKGPNGKPLGCKGNGGCSSGGCNRLNVFDWLSDLPFSAQQSDCRIVEISFKNGSRKGFYRNTNYIDCHTGDLVVVESTQGYDIGTISLSGELVRLQMKKKKVKDNDQLLPILRRANNHDLDRLGEIKKQEYGTMLLARVIANQLNLDMKIGDVEYQGDGRKATFYYTADSRVDFRELIKLYAKEFRVKIEMRQIGARQEASRIGGIGSCGRELCCSTWLTSFKSVSTTAARYQNLAINQSKLSGQCGRLKCCLNYELDTYLEALQDFPKHAEQLMLKKGAARLTKTDIFKRKMWYSPYGANTTYALKVQQVKEILAMNARGERPESLAAWVILDQEIELSSIELEEEGLEDIGNATLAELEKDREKRRRRKRKRRSRSKEQGTIQQPNSTTPRTSKSKEIGKPKFPPTKEGKKRTEILPKLRGNNNKKEQKQTGKSNTTPAKQDKTKQNIKTARLSNVQKDGDRKRTGPIPENKNKTPSISKQQPPLKSDGTKREGRKSRSRNKPNVSKSNTHTKSHKSTTNKNKVSNQNKVNTPKSKPIKPRDEKDNPNSSDNK